MRETIKVELPILAKLMLSELAERRGKTDQQVLVELIWQAAIRELGEIAKACTPAS